MLAAIHFELTILLLLTLVNGAFPWRSWRSSRRRAPGWHTGLMTKRSHRRLDECGG